MNLTAIDHVGIAVDDLDAAIGRYGSLFAVAPVHRERVDDQGVDEVLFEVGETCRSLYVVAEGKVQIGQVSARGREQVLHTEGPGATPWKSSQNRLP